MIKKTNDQSNVVLIRRIVALYLLGSIGGRKSYTPQMAIPRTSRDVRCFVKI